MKSISGKQLAKAVERAGWRLLRGTAAITSTAGPGVPLSIPKHANKPLKLGLLKHLLKMASPSESDL